MSDETICESAQEIVTTLIEQGWTYYDGQEEPMNPQEARWWAERPELNGEQE